MAYIHKWQDIKGYEGLYQVSTDGFIRRILKDGSTLIRKTQKGGPNKKVSIINLFKNGKYCQHRVMKLVADAFLGEIPAGKIVYHRDGNQQNNAMLNLGLTTRSALLKSITSNAYNRKPVKKIAPNGEVVDFYSSILQASKKNFMSKSAMRRRCNGTLKRDMIGDPNTYEFDK